MAKKDMDSEIENRIAFRCSKQWGDLEKTGDDRVKLCNQCNESVHLAESIEELDAHAEHDRCVMLRLKDSKRDTQGEKVEPCAAEPEEDLPEIGGFFFRRDDGKEKVKFDTPPFLGRPFIPGYKPEPEPEKEGWLTRLLGMFGFKKGA